MTDNERASYFTADNLIREWEQDGFRLELYETFNRAPTGQEELAYRFFDNGRLIFEGADYGCSPMDAIDSDESVAGLLGFLSCKPGDTDSEYFDSYTPEQMEWVESGRAEELGYIQYDMENPEDSDSD